MNRYEFEASNAGLFDTNPAAAWAIIIFAILFILLMIISLWKIFTKAGKPGWAAIVPIYNIIVMVQIGKKPGWWAAIILLAGIIPIAGPIVALVFNIMLTVAIAKNFGKSGGFAAGMILLGFIFYPILAFGDAKYQPANDASNPDLLDS